MVVFLLLPSLLSPSPTFFLQYLTMLPVLALNLGPFSFCFLSNGITGVCATPDVKVMSFLSHCYHQQQEEKHLRDGMELSSPMGKSQRK